MQKPQRVLAMADAAAQYRWETESKPQIVRRARQKHAIIFFEDEMTLETQGTVGYTWARIGQTPETRLFGRHKGVKAFGAISAHGLFAIACNWTISRKSVPCLSRDLSRRDR